MAAAGPLFAAALPAAASTSARRPAQAVRPVWSYDGFGPKRDKSRLVGLIVVVALHVAAGIALLTYQPAREMLGIEKVVTVQFITPPAPPKPEPPKEEPKPKEVQIVKKTPPVPKPIIATTAPTPSPIEVTPPPEPPKPQPPVEAAPPAPPAPVAPPAPAQPKVISGVSYIEKPPLEYPAISKRLNEQGQVHMKVTVNAQGKAEKIEVTKSSGYSRLDEAARKAMLAARFRPYMENGVPIPVIVNDATLTFDLKDGG